MKQLIGILGLGIFGSSIAKTLSEFDDVEVIAVDENMENIERIADYVTQAVCGDITQRSFLESIGIQDCDTVVIAAGSHLESSILAIMHVKNLGVKRIISKAKNHSYMEIFKQIGATDVIRPEKEMGEKLARDLVRRHVIDVIELDENHQVVEFKVPESWIGQSLLKLDVRKNYAMNILGVKQNKVGALDVTIGANYEFNGNEIVVALTDSKKFEQHDILNKL